VYLELLATLAIAAYAPEPARPGLRDIRQQEFGLVELADAHSRASALMRQKKKSLRARPLRTQAVRPPAAVASALAALHTGSARTDHFHCLNGTVPRALDEAVAIARLTASCLTDRAAGGRFRSDRTRELRHRAGRAASSAYRRPSTTAVRTRSSAGAVRDLVDRREPSSQLTPDRLAAASVAAIGRPIEIDEATLGTRSIPPRYAAARRRTGRRRRPLWTRCSTGFTRRLTAHEGGARRTARRRLRRPALLARARDLAEPGSSRRTSGRRDAGARSPLRRRPRRPIQRPHTKASS